MIGAPAATVGTTKSVRGIHHHQPICVGLVSRISSMATNRATTAASTAIDWRAFVLADSNCAAIWSRCNSIVVR
jgi:hypothetical protein